MELSLPEAREILDAWAASTTWKRRGLGSSLDVREFEQTGAFHVMFESFTESRGVAGRHRPHTGGAVDGPEQGDAPGPWEMRIPVGRLFESRTKSYVVPHTEVVRTCHGCGGRGEVTCARCGGGGEVRCTRCGGDGRRTVTRHRGGKRVRKRVRCTRCLGSGDVSCSRCGGDGDVTCKTCRGARQLVHFDQLTVEWVNHVGNQVLEGTELPDHLVPAAAGDVAFREEENVIEPVRGSGGAGSGPFRGGRVRVNRQVNEALNSLIAEHRFPASTKLHRQRATARAVPVWEARYHWKKSRRRFWIYGDDLRVHAPDYPLSIKRIGTVIGAALVVVGGAFWSFEAITAPPPSTTTVDVEWHAPAPRPVLDVPDVPEPTPIEVQPDFFDRFREPPTPIGADPLAPGLRIRPEPVPVDLDGPPGAEPEFPFPADIVPAD